MSKKEKVFYTADGIVVGDYWGAGRGYYAAEKYGSEKFGVVKDMIKKDFESGALDSGMGYEGLTGAMMIIVKHTVIVHKGKMFRNESSRRMWLGKINKREAVEVYDSE